MTQFSDAALLKGGYATMLKNPPKEAEWKKTACDNGSELAAQSVAKQIFAFQKSIDPAKEKLEVVTFSALGPIKVLGITPMDGELMRIDGVRPDNNAPVSMIQHVEQLSLTFTKAPVKSGNPEEQPDEDDGMQIGFVIFDELKERKKVRDAAKRKKPARKPQTKRATTKK
ncbi:MAG: hypothetical protein AAF423_05210 [Pseudomonadota bacterium]